jgi:hypothetical protein
MRKMIISAKKLNKPITGDAYDARVDISTFENNLDDRGMRAAIRYLRNLGQYRRQGVLISPVKKGSANPSSFLAIEAINGTSLNLDEENCSPQSPMQLTSPFGVSDERINTIPLINT